MCMQVDSKKRNARVDCRIFYIFNAIRFHSACDVNSDWAWPIKFVRFLEEPVKFEMQFSMQFFFKDCETLHHVLPEERKEHDVDSSIPQTSMARVKHRFKNDMHFVLRRKQWFTKICLKVPVCMCKSTSCQR